MLKLTDCPHLTTLTTDAKLSSRMMMSELSFATSVPWIPIERPISAYVYIVWFTLFFARDIFYGLSLFSESEIGQHK